MASVHIGCCEELTVPWCCRFMVGSDFQWGYHGATMGYSGNISRYYIVIYIYNNNSSGIIMGYIYIYIYLYLWMIFVEQ